MDLTSELDQRLGSSEALEQLDSFVWCHLSTALDSREHPWNEACFSTLAVRPGKPSLPKSRMVILRGVDQHERSVDCYTDVRSSKISELDASGGGACWLFYRADSKIQLRLEGQATILDGELADRAWRNTPLRSREAYLSLATPGNEVSGSEPPDTSDRSVDEDASERGRANFRIVRTHVVSGDLLYLRRGGHVRARLSCDSNQKPTWRWIVP